MIFNNKSVYASYYINIHTHIISIVDLDHPNADPDTAFIVDAAQNPAMKLIFPWLEDIFFYLKIIITIIGKFSMHLRVCTLKIKNYPY